MSERGIWLGAQTETRSQSQRVDLNNIQFVVAERGFPLEVAKAVRRRDNNTCQGIDDRNGLAICSFEYIKIDGKRAPASLDQGFWIDISHYDHNKNKPVYFTAEGVRCQCKACHMLYSQGIGHKGSVVKIARSDVYLPEAKDWKKRNGYPNLDLTLARPSLVLDALAEALYRYGVEWNYDEREHRCFPKVPENWVGPGTREQVVDLTNRLYVPKPLDIAIWNWDSKKR